MSIGDWYWPGWGCSDPPEESCSDAGCPVHGWDREDESMADDRCPDCGRASCTGEGCYWPDEAGIDRHGGPWSGLAARGGAS